MTQPRAPLSLRITFYSLAEESFHRIRELNRTHYHRSTPELISRQFSLVFKGLSCAASTLTSKSTGEKNQQLLLSISTSRFLANNGGENSSDRM